MLFMYVFIRMRSKNEAILKNAFIRGVTVAVREIWEKDNDDDDGGDGDKSMANNSSQIKLNSINL